MTLIELFKEQHPNGIILDKGTIVERPSCCPYELGYEETKICEKHRSITCWECWGREAKSELIYSLTRGMCLSDCCPRQQSFSSACRERDAYKAAFDKLKKKCINIASTLADADE